MKKLLFLALMALVGTFIAWPLAAFGAAGLAIILPIHATAGVATEYLARTNPPPGWNELPRRPSMWVFSVIFGFLATLIYVQGWLYPLEKKEPSAV